jgi:hypothetical protein
MSDNSLQESWRNSSEAVWLIWKCGTQAPIGQALTSAIDSRLRANGRGVFATRFAALGDGK